MQNKFKVFKDNGVIHYVWGKGTIIDKELLEEALKKRAKLTKGIPHPIFSDLRGVEYWTMDSRSMIGPLEVRKDVTAYAVLVSSDAMETITNWVKNFVLDEKIPAEIFSREEDALKWIEQYKVQ